MKIENGAEKIFQKQRYLFKGHNLVTQNILDAKNDAKNDDGVI